MSIESQVEIISCNTDNEAICAGAARISTTEGNALYIFEKSKSSTKNSDLIKKVLQSGHKSFIEHAVFTIAFKDVSAYVEQFFIECRLASFTIKSRRYVDFSNLGYYIPNDLSSNELSHYCLYMDVLFSAYQKMLAQGIPREDARFLLPYSFYSNFYCTINARELAQVIRAIKHGRGREIPELQNLANQLITQIKKLFPAILLEFECIPEQHSINAPIYDSISLRDEPTFIESEDIGLVELISSPQHPYETLAAAYKISCQPSTRPFEIDLLVKSERPRELEQLSYSFLISNITLSGTTHIVRHRMQSVIIPPIQSVNHSKYIIPDTIKNDPVSYNNYIDILTSTYSMIVQQKDNSTFRKYRYYYALSANVMDIMTTLNARELMHFIRLRACNRAQWEIRDISIKMLNQLRASFPELFGKLGPNCYIGGHCPEGKMTCGRMNEVISQFQYRR